MALRSPQSPPMPAPAQITSWLHYVLTASLVAPLTGGWCRHTIGIAAHKTTRSRAIGSSFVAPKKPTMRRSDRIAPPMASTLHHPNGTNHPITASAARINKSAALPPSQTPEMGYSPEAGIRPNSPLSPIDQGQAHLNSPPNSL